MSRYLPILLSVIFTLLLASSTIAAEEKFDTEKIMTELEQKLKLSSEKLSELKPQIDAKSKELKKSIQESVDEGFVHLDEMNKELNSVTKEIDAQVQKLLTSEEFLKFKDVLAKIDKDAIEEAKKELVNEMSEILRLTEEQLTQLEPMLEDTVNKLNELVTEFAEAGASNWEEFKRKYEKLSKELRNSLDKTLESDQLDRLDKYNEEKKDKIHDKLIAI